MLPVLSQNLARVVSVHCYSEIRIRQSTKSLQWKGHMQHGVKVTSWFSTAMSLTFIPENTLINTIEGQGKEGQSFHIYLTFREQTGARSLEQMEYIHHWSWIYYLIQTTIFQGENYRHPQLLQMNPSLRKEKRTFSRSHHLYNCKILDSNSLSKASQRCIHVYRPFSFLIPSGAHSVQSHFL